MSVKKEIALTRVFIAQQRGQQPQPWDLLEAGLIVPAPYVPAPAGTCALCGETTMDNDQAEFVQDGQHVHAHAECGLNAGLPLA